MPRSSARSSLAASLARRASRPPSTAAGARHRVAPAVGQAQREAAAIVGIGLALDQPGADQRIDRAADRRGAALDRGGDLVERRRLGLGDRGEQVALLARRLGRGGVAAQLLDQPREARRERRCVNCFPTCLQASKCLRGCKVAPARLRCVTQLHRPGLHEPLLA